jgi:hypothetical protein
LQAVSPITGIPMTMACWFNTPANSVQKTLISVGISGATHRCLLQISTTNTLQAFTVGSVSASSNYGTAITGNVWNHGCGVFAATNSRTAYLNGDAATTNTGNSTTNPFNNIAIGARWATTLGIHMRGLLADVGIWNVALTQAEIQSLADGMACDKVRPQSLVFYAPLVREFIDKKGISISNNNETTVSNHTRIYA